MGIFSAINPLLLWGGLAVASPIIIHLLSKRRFRIVSWAAMDFLLQADEQNRRRVRLEHLLLLLLRCLIILLLALLLARLVFDPSGLGAAGISFGRCEHVVLLDDSPSMGARSEEGTAFDEAKSEIKRVIRALSDARPQDSFTLLLTSDPERPVEQGVALGHSNLDALSKQIDELETSDIAARMDDALLAVRDQITEAGGDVNRAVMIISDFKQRDWRPEETAGNGKEGTLRVLERLAEENSEIPIQLGISGADNVSNVGITRIQPPRGTVAYQVPTRFEVTLKNFGDVDATDIELLFSVEGTIPLRNRVPSIAPGETASVPFTFYFQEQGPAAIEVEIGRDNLPADNKRYFAAQVGTGAKVLLVDGEPAIRAAEAESFFVRYALSPPGDIRSGYDLTVISENQLDGQDFSSYDLVILANVFRLSGDRADALASWVRDGGGLAIFMGDQVDSVSYDELHEQYAGLMPLRLDRVLGDPQEDKWVSLVPEEKGHPMLKVFGGEANPLLARVKFFRWWGATIEYDKVPEDSSLAVLATFDDLDQSPALLQSNVGRGRVLISTTAADSEWSTWPTNPSYVVVMQEMGRHLARRASMHRQIEAGEVLREAVDPAEYALDAAIIRPETSDRAVLQATSAGADAGMAFEYPDTDRAGVYRIEVKRRDGGPETRVFAVNTASDEGDLTPVPPASRREMEEITNLTISDGGISGLGSAGIQRVELWRPLVIALVLALCCEQALAWWFGKRRT